MSSAASTSAPWDERRFTAMGSTAHVVVLDGPPGLVDWAESEVARLEALWSRFRADSDISRCNRGAGAGPTEVSPETVHLVGRALGMWRLTEGAFDPTVLHALEAGGYDASFEIVRDRQEAERITLAPPPGLHARSRELARTGATPPIPAPGCGGIVVDPNRSTVSLPAGVGLDLGGIGKGATADLVAERVVARGARGACIGLGGDIRCAGHPPTDRGWEIPVEDPFDENRLLFTRRITDGAIVTSTRLFHRWFHDGRWQHHLIDPATGEPAAAGLAAVIVAAPKAWRAESLAKATFVVGTRRGVALLESEGVTGWLIDDHREITESSLCAERAPVRSRSRRGEEG